ncbi:MAG: bifunctional folylpolyglutamate synthase/dihydrofolate synthase [Terrimicrobiaceae bacterium]
MTPEEALDWLYASESTGIKLGLENTNRLLAACGHPERRLRFLHIAGTNGKGSTCAMLDSILRRAGYCTGLYTSPHLVDFRERIRVDGEMIPREDLAEGLSRLREVVRDWLHGPTFFEISTVLAIDHFARSGCDIVVLETGMGGRLDSTNAVTPLVSTITPIDMDHMQWLGDTLEKIAAEKAGIIKPGIPVVSAPQQPAAAEVLRTTTLDRGTSIRIVAEPCALPLSLAGVHQKWNAALAVETLRASDLAISESAIRDGLLATEWPARFQRVGERFIVDGAHNSHSATALVQTWREVFAGCQATVVFGALADKDYPEILALLEPLAARFLFVPVENPRTESPAVLAPRVHRPAHIHATLESALRASLDFPEPVLVTGSLFLAGEALRVFEQNPALRACDGLAPG